MAKMFAQFAKDVEKVPSGYQKTVLDMHGGMTHPDDSQEPENYEYETPKPKPPKGNKVVVPFAEEARVRVNSIMEEITGGFDDLIHMESYEKLSDMIRLLYDLRDNLYDDGQATATATDAPTSVSDDPEPYFEGEIALKDGSKINITESDAQYLNRLTESVGGKHLMKTLLNNEQEFRSILNYSRLAEAAIQRNLDQKAPVHVSGIKGKKARPFTKDFKNYEAYETWAHSKEADDCDIQHVFNESHQIIEGREGEREHDDYDKYASHNTRAARERDLRKHKFASTQGGDSSNYKDGHLKQDKINEATVKDLEGYPDRPQKTGVGKTYQKSFNTLVGEFDKWKKKEANKKGLETDIKPMTHYEADEMKACTCDKGEKCTCEKEVKENVFQNRPNVEMCVCGKQLRDSCNCGADNYNKKTNSDDDVQGD